MTVQVRLCHMRLSASDASPSDAVRCVLPFSAEKGGPRCWI
jgi:hypothetical protein